MVRNDNKASKFPSVGIYKKGTTSTQYKPNLYLDILYHLFPHQLFSNIAFLFRAFKSSCSYWSWKENLSFLSNCSMNNCFWKPWTEKQYSKTVNKRCSLENSPPKTRRCTNKNKNDAINNFFCQGDLLWKFSKSQHNFKLGN